MRNDQAYLAKRIVNRRGWRGKPLRTLRRHVETVFKADSELPWNVYAGFIGKAHAGLQQSRLAMDEVDGFMAIHPYAMPRSMREAWQPVSGAITKFLIPGAHLVIHASRWHTKPGSF